MNKLVIFIVSILCFIQVSGQAVSMSGYFAFVGANWDDENVLGIDYLNNAGSAYIFSLCDTSGPIIGDTINPIACDSYTSPSGNHIWDSSGTYLDTVLTANLCDSMITVNLTINNSTASTINPSVCASYTSPSGNYVWDSAGTYMDTILNAVLCDSIITVNLTINNTTGSFNGIVCDSYTSPSGNYIWDSTGTYLDTLPNAALCDSIITFNLTIAYSGNQTINPIACDSYTSPSGNHIWTSSGTYLDTINNPGCDSFFIINLSIANSTASMINPTACDSYTSPSGKVWDSTNTYLDTIPNAALCDSVITVNLTINNSSTFDTIVVACDSIEWDSIIYTNSTTVVDSFINSVGCDSLVILHLTINTVNNSVTHAGNILVADEVGANYQWLDCKDSNAVISGEINNSFVATANGSYAVEVTKNNCTDTSACIEVSGIGILENDFGSALRLYPNPNLGSFTIDLGISYREVLITISNLNGQLISTQVFQKASRIPVTLAEPPSLYFVRIETANGKSALIKVLKE